jgi:hypothetical protein
MPVILYTNERFDVGSVFDTRDYCDLNRRALEEATPEEREVEEFLEEVRREHFHGAPDRVCAVVGMLLPSKESNVRHERGWGTTEMPAPEPMGTGAHCYHIQPARGAEHILADEGLVGRLVQDWHELKGRFEKWKLAQAYWSGNVVRGYSMLIRGPVNVKSECRWPSGGRRLKPVVWEAD